MSTLEKQPITLEDMTNRIYQRMASSRKFSGIEIEVRKTAWNARGENFEVLVHPEDPKSQQIAVGELGALVAEVTGTLCLIE